MNFDSNSAHPNFICKHREAQIPNFLNKSGIFCSLGISFPLVLVFEKFHQVGTRIHQDKILKQV
jgi:hypothetical protein